MESVILVVNEQCIITDFNRSQALFVSLVAVNLFKGVESQLFVTQDTIVVELIARLLRVELVLEDVNFVVQRLQFVEES